MNECNLVSISTGKDSGATLLTAKERGVPNIKAVMADTGHEHPLAYEYADYLEKELGIEIVRIKPDFSEQIEHKREIVKTTWMEKLLAGKPGKWKLKRYAKKLEVIPEPPKTPFNQFTRHETEHYKWQQPMEPISEQAAKRRIKDALDVLHPTGNPFLDMCLWKGRFPSSQARFCTEELKKKAIMQYQESLLEEYDRINVWVGVRRDESEARSKIENEWELEFGTEEFGIWLYRPILDWTVEDVFAMHRKHNIEPNPLYKMGMGRVGCMPCIMCRKDELKTIGERCGEEIDRVENWEQIVSKASLRGKATFFSTSAFHDIPDNRDIDIKKHGIRSGIEWAKTSKGGRQFNMFDQLESIPVCTSVYGLCDTEQPLEKTA